MNNHPWIIFLLAAFVAMPTQADEPSNWFRHAAISPDGKSILFSYHGDLFTVSNEGGVARALTTHAAWDGNPVWSRDGKQIAFASDRHGNLDVFLMPARVDSPPALQIIEPKLPFLLLNVFGFRFFVSFNSLTNRLVCRDREKEKQNKEEVFL